MAFRSGTILNVALVAAALGFGLIDGPVGLVAKVIAVIFFVRFGWSLQDAPATIRTVDHGWPSQSFAHQDSAAFHPDDQA